MRVTVLFFAGVRQALGISSEPFDLPEGSRVGALWQVLSERHPPLARWEDRLKIAVNEEFADRSTPLAEGSVVALLPPVSGGAGRAVLTSEPLRPESLLRDVPGAGACVTFAGTVRPAENGVPIQGLRYEAYTAMAERKLEAVCDEALARFPLLDIRIVHRHGVVPAGANAVLVAAWSERRDAAFDAARFAIERIKEIVPIWKEGRA